MKDNFSSESEKYAQYRPDYPEELYRFIYSQIENKERAWDCGTGNGQVAQRLAETFDEVYATDISEEQLDNAFQKENIHYSMQAAEKVDFRDNFFDLIVVAQAIHWLNFHEFYAETRRTGKEGAVLVVMGYGMLKIDSKIDVVIKEIYQGELRGYWDSERKYIDEEYMTIPFPFEEIEVPDFEIRLNWTLDHLVGYLKTWSAVKHYTTKNGKNPIDKYKEKLVNLWPAAEVLEVVFPVLLRIAKIHK